MPRPQDAYVKCDILEHLPALNKDNWLFELRLLSKGLVRDAHVLQVGSMDGTRIMRLLDVRSDLKCTGLEIEASLVDLARKKIASTDLSVDFVQGDITCPPDMSEFDYVLCLNNTLGYIDDKQRAVEHMKSLGKDVIISVYGEAFTDEIARAYFASLGLEIERIDGNTILLKGFTSVKRFTREEVDFWNGEVIETPLGYYCVL